MPVHLPLLTAPAAGCSCQTCPWYSGRDALRPVLAPLCSGTNPDCMYCGCAQAEAATPTSAGCSSCPVRCGSRTDIDRWMRELGGTLTFDDVRIGGQLPAGLPRFVPMLDGSKVTDWDTDLHWPAYGIGLRRVFSPATGSIFPRFRGRTAREILGLADDQLAVLVGYGEDPLVEAFWTRRHGEQLIDQLADNRWDLVLAPNFSIFGTWPRAQHLISMRMSLLIAQEIAAAGIATVPNLYWFRLEDLERWADWIDVARPPAIAVNLQTVRDDTDWASWVLPGLHWLPENIPDDLPVILTGLSRPSRIRLATDLFGSRLTLVSQNPQQYALHGAVMTNTGREDRHARPVDAFTASVAYMASLLPAARKAEPA